MSVRWEVGGGWVPGVGGSATPPWASLASWRPGGGSAVDIFAIVKIWVLIVRNSYPHECLGSGPTVLVSRAAVDHPAGFPHANAQSTMA